MYYSSIISKLNNQNGELTNKFRAVLSYNIQLKLTG